MLKIVFFGLFVVSTSAQSFLDILTRNQMQKMLNNTLAPTTSVPLTTTPLPTTSIQLTTTPLPITSCTTSSSNGKQSLSNGDEVYCEDGWTVFQRRFDGSVDFQVGWDAYVNGFGSKSGEFWLGLRKIHQLTEVEGCRLRVDLKDFEGNQAYAEYRSFSVANEDDLFRIRVSGYSGSADDDLRHHDYHVFSTFDRDNDPYYGANCATLKGRGQGGWWFHGSCYHCALNAAWGRSEGSYHNIVWQDWKGPRHALQATTMKLRCD